MITNLSSIVSPGAARTTGFARKGGLRGDASALGTTRHERIVSYGPSQGSSRDSVSRLKPFIDLH